MPPTAFKSPDCAIKPILGMQKEFSNWEELLLGSIDTARWSVMARVTLRAKEQVWVQSFSPPPAFQSSFSTHYWLNLQGLQLAKFPALLFLKRNKICRVPALASQSRIWKSEFRAERQQVNKWHSNHHALNPFAVLQLYIFENGFKPPHYPYW